MNADLQDIKIRKGTEHRAPTVYICGNQRPN